MSKGKYELAKTFSFYDFFKSKGQYLGGEKLWFNVNDHEYVKNENITNSLQHCRN